MEFGLALGDGRDSAGACRQGSRPPISLQPRISCTRSVARKQSVLAGVEAFGDVANDRAKHQRVLQGAVCPNTAATAAATQALQFRTAVGHAKPARVNKPQGVHKLEISKLVHIAPMFQHLGNKHREIEFEAAAQA